MRLRLFSLLVLWPTMAAAQEAPAVLAVRAHFLGPETARTAQDSLAADDLGALRPVAVRTDALRGLTTVTMVQTYEGVEVLGTASTAIVRRDGAVEAPAPHFERRLAQRAGPSTPALSAEQAASVAVDQARASAEAGAAALDAGAPRLGYHPEPGGALRLVWDVVVSAPRGPAVLRAVRVDALTGAVVLDADLVTHDTWPGAPRAGHPGGRPGAPPAARAVVFVGGAAPAPAAGPSYRVVPAPFESPSVSDLVLVTDPADPVASPLGWHDDGARSYTITRGNNAFAYADTNDDDFPDFQSPPDGGPDLRFDFAFDPDRSPERNAPAAITNLFYWTNIAHDVLYRYGFDEAAGNFQATNRGEGGAGGDPVQAEALDGSGVDNANFSTPPDGTEPRMQMFRWRGAPRFTVLAPTSIAGEYAARGASFGPPGRFNGRVVVALGPAGQTTGCPGAGIATDVTGRVALLERGGCLFAEKVREAEAAGALAVVVYNRPAQPDGSGGDELVSMGGDGFGINIPSAFVGRSTGLLLAGADEPVRIAVDQQAERDSGLDAGVVVHEYGHGVSNRLIGGPDRVACLLNGFTHGRDATQNRPGEQMGEGWSDVYGLLLTQRSGDSGRQARGVGTYLRFETPDGPGIRPAPYSTDFAINDYTYQDVIDHASHDPVGARGLSIPHGVGFVWASALWDMTWELIDAHGFSDDLRDAGGTAGNQIALNLVTTGLSLTPCTPGFVDGRDAILAADRALYDGAHADLIWRAFARRGLGISAQQGSPTAHTDGRASFREPVGLGAVTLAAPSVRAAVGPGASETVRVELRSARAVAQPFRVGEVPSWLAVSPSSGTLPANGSVTLEVTLRPAPLDAGQLAASVPVIVGEEETTVALRVDVDTDVGVGGVQLSVLGPNPARDEVRFTLAAPEAEPIRVSLFDRLGRRIGAPRTVFGSGGRERVTFDVSGLASGLYVLRVEGDGFAESRVFTVVR